MALTQVSNGMIASGVTLATPTLTSPTITGAVVSSMASSVVTAKTALATTSGTSVDFTGIPSWVKRVTVLFASVSTNGTSVPIIQLGTGGTPTTTGYVASSSEVYTSVGTVSSTTGFNIYWNSAGYSFSGAYELYNVSGNIWVGSSVTANTASTVVTTMSAGTVTLSGTLDMVRITTTNGTDVFDAGTINIFYQ